MNQDLPTNDNKERADELRDRDYVADYIAKACVHFTEIGVSRQLIADAMLSELFKTLASNPFRTGEDEGAIVADQSFLWTLKHRILPMSELWDKAWVRLQYEKRPTFLFGRATGPKQERPARPEPWPVDYDLSRHEWDLRLLKLRPGHRYTEREVIKRYQRKLLRAMGNRHVEGQDRVKYLSEAKQRLVDWIRRNEAAVKARTTA